MSRTYHGDIIHKNDNTSWEDCCVTGSNDGLVSEPTSSLKRILKEPVFPHIKTGSEWK